MEKELKLDLQPKSSILNRRPCNPINDASQRDYGSEVTQIKRQR